MTVAQATIVAHENETFRIEVGVPPTPKDQPEMLAYLIINKQFGVIENIQAVLHYAKQWADQMDKFVRGVEAEPAFPEWGKAVTEGAAN